MTTTLDQRYGRTPTLTARKRSLFIGLVAAFAVVFGAWLLWAGLFGPAAELDVEDVGHVLVDDSLVQVRYQLTVAPGTEARCAVQALNEGFGVVGWRIIDVPASASRVRVLATEVRTSEQAVTGLIYRCWPA